MLEVALSIVGVVAIIRGSLTISRRHPLKGPRARVAGLLLAMALPLLFAVLTAVFALASRGVVPYSMEGPILRALDHIPGIIAIIAASVYLYATDPERNRALVLFWVAAAVPAAGIFFARNLTPLFRLLFDLSMRLPIPLAAKLALPDLVTGVLFPIALAFAANLVYPAASDRRSAVAFAIPAAGLHALYYAVSDWVVPAISSIAYPGDTPGAGYVELANGISTLAVSALLMGLVAYAALAATRKRSLPRSAA